MFPMAAAKDESFKESELGIETEAEKQMKVMLEKQLDTKITLKEHFEKHRQFTSPSTYTPLCDLIKGSCSLEKFKEVEAIEEEHQKLQRSGLTQDEIELFLSRKEQGVCPKRSFPQEPSVKSEKLEQIIKKIKAHETKLSIPEVFSNTKTLSRHEMELEKTLYSGCTSKTTISKALISEKTESDLSENDPFKHVKALHQKLSQRRLFKNVPKRFLNKSMQSSQSDDYNEEEFVYNANLHHVIVPIDYEEVCHNKMRTEDIMKIPKFENHQAGTPNKVLYLKNLNPKVRIQELMALFMRFETEKCDPIRYRILTGRMKGQAFVTFSDIQTAEKALNFAHGFVLREKPIIIQFGTKVT